MQLSLDGFGRRRCIPRPGPNMKEFRNFKICAITFICVIISGCVSLHENSFEIKTIEKFSHANSKVICAGPLRVNIPDNWKVKTSTEGTIATGQQGEQFELKSLRKPTISQSTVSTTAKNTLDEFISLKNSSIEKTNYINWERFSPLPFSEDFSAASSSILYQYEDGMAYGVQYFLAQPDIIYMITFDRFHVTEEDIIKDVPRFDAIVNTARFSKIIVNAGSSMCL